MITSVKKKVKFAAAQEAVKEKHTMDIPRDKILLLRRIKKENDQLFRLGIKNQEKRFIQIQRNLGLLDKDCKELIPLALNETVSLEKSIGNEDDGTRDMSIHIEKCILKTNKNMYFTTNNSNAIDLRATVIYTGKDYITLK